MTAAFEQILPQLLKGALCLALGTLMLRWLLTRRFHDAPGWCRLACVLVLLPGWMLFSVPVKLAVLEANSPGQSRPDKELTPRLVPASSVETRVTPENSLRARARRVIGMAWLGGTAILPLLWAFNYARLLLRLRAARPAPLPWWRRWRRLGGHQSDTPAVLVCEGVGPLLCRLPGRAALVLPSAFLAGTSLEEKEAILRHEWAHHQRGDLWKSFAVRLLALPQWFNPAAWWTVQTFIESAEWACDDAAAGTPEERLLFANVLQRLAGKPRRLLVGVHASAEHPLVTRVRRLVATTRSGTGPWAKASLLTLLALLLTGATVRVELVTREPGPASLQVGTTTGTVREVSASQLLLTDAEGRVCRLTIDVQSRQGNVDFASIQPGEHFSVKWTNVAGRRCIRLITGEGVTAGTVRRVEEKALELAPSGGGHPQRFEAPWVGDTHGGYAPEILELIAHVKPGSQVEVRWSFDERKRVRELRPASGG
ncbi:MAG: M56 family metallopeptidase [Verrucomicrobiales bacterium]|nr:M56 family metallopeptidase [Verrucomicrobiales bacterium]